MRICIKMFVLVLVFFSLYSYAKKTSFRGDMHGGGGDSAAPGSDSAWFLGRKPVLYCIEVSDNFGVDKARAQNEIQAAIELWKKYITEKKLIDPLQPDLELSLDWKYEYICDGKEDLTFYLGVMRPEIGIEKSKYNNPAAFATRTAYDFVKHWGKGYLWFAESYSVFPEVKFPMWNKYLNLRLMLLHEIGHVLGCGHIKDTIMDVDIADLVGNAGGTFSEKDNLIDLYSEFAHCDVCDRSYTGILGGDEFDSKKSAKIFSFLTGRNPVGKIGSKIHISNVDTVVLTLNDSVSSRVFRFSLPNKMLHSDIQEIFKRAWSRSGSSSISETSEFRSIETFLTRLTIFNGKKLTIFVSDSPFSIEFVNSKGEHETLFQAVLHD